jgi:2-succinyl-6-hydroxy-2,4-cyclohexadiene-1-carboxylate synthase
MLPRGDEMKRVHANGLAFEVNELGRGDPLVLLHGFTGCGESWWPVIDTLAATFRTITIDLIGHGGSASPPTPDRYGFDLALGDLAAIAAQLGIAQAAWLGYSMGGRLALGLALRHPELVSSLILVSATPGIADAAERAARRIADEELARHIERVGVADFVAEWERRPMWRSQQTLSAPVLERQRQLRLLNTPRALANSLRGMGQGAQPSLWDRLGAIEFPTLLIAGTEDAKFAGIAADMSDAFGDARLVLAQDAGHAVHLEAPDFYAEHVLTFLTESCDFAAAHR